MFDTVQANGQSLETGTDQVNIWPVFTMSKIDILIRSNEPQGEKKTEQLRNPIFSQMDDMELDRV